MQKLVEMWHNDFDANDGHELDEWCDGYKKHKEWKKKIGGPWYNRIVRCNNELQTLGTC